MRNLILLLSLLLAAPAWAEPVASAPLNAQERADVARIETYLNELKSVAADFSQINDGGEFRHGQIAILRPGRMRVTYDPPQKDFIVADGSTVHIWDAEMEQQTNLPVGASIAELILRDPIKLSGEVTVTRYERFPAKLELTVTSTKDPGEGQLTLVFEDRPLVLRQWRVVDAQGRTTGVSLENAREGVAFADNTFDFVPPTFGGPKSNRK